MAEGDVAVNGAPVVDLASQCMMDLYYLRGLGIWLLSVYCNYPCLGVADGPLA